MYEGIKAGVVGVALLVAGAVNVVDSEPAEAHVKHCVTKNVEHRKAGYLMQFKIRYKKGGQWYYMYDRWEDRNKWGVYTDQVSRHHVRCPVPKR